MEEVDRLILRGLKDAGCKIGDAQSLDDLSPHDIFGAVVLCMEALDSEFKAPRPIPTQTASKVSLAVKLSSKIRGLGYRSKVEYQQLIYPSVEENRKLLSWFIGQIVSAAEDSQEQPSSGPPSTYKSLSTAMVALLKEPWVPEVVAWTASAPKKRAFQKVNYKDSHPVCVSSFTPLTYTHLPRPSHDAVKEFMTHHLRPLTTEPIHRENVFPSVSEAAAAEATLKADEEADWVANGVGKAPNPWSFKQKKRKMLTEQFSSVFSSDASRHEGKGFSNSHHKNWDVYSQRGRNKGFPAGQGRFARKMKMAFQDQFKKREEQESVREEERQKMLKQADADYEELFSSLEAKKKEMADMQNMIQQNQMQITEETNQFEILKAKHQQTKKVYDFLPNSKEYIQKLQDLSAHSSEILQKLAAEWEKHRRSLIQQLRDRRNDLYRRSQKANARVEEIRAINEEIARLKAELEAREAQHQNMLALYASLPHDLTRGMFTDRILAVIKQLKKQQREIDKILLETRDLKGEIDGLKKQRDEQLDAAIEAAEEACKTKGKVGEASQVGLSNIIAVHESYEKLVDVLVTSGGFNAQVDVVKHKNEKLAKRMDDIDLEKVVTDLDEIRESNEQQMTKEERMQRLEERRKEQEKIESVNKLEVDPFPECLPMKEKLMREYLERRRREVEAWQNEFKEKQEKYRKGFEDIDKTIKETNFGADSEAIKAFLETMEDEEIGYVKTSRESKEGVLDVWNEKPPYATEEDLELVAPVLEQAKQTHEDLLALMEWRKKEHERVLEKTLEDEARERLVISKLKEFDEKLGAYKSWLADNKKQIENSDVNVAAFADVQKQRDKYKADDDSLTAQHTKFQEDMKNRLEELAGLDAEERAPANYEFLDESNQQLVDTLAARKKRLEANVQEYSISAYCTAAAIYQKWTSERIQEADETALSDELVELRKAYLSLKPTDAKITETSASHLENLRLLWSRIAEMGEEATSDPRLQEILVPSMEILRTNVQEALGRRWNRHHTALLAKYVEVIRAQWADALEFVGDLGKRYQPEEADALEKEPTLEKVAAWQATRKSEKTKGEGMLSEITRLLKEHTEVKGEGEEKERGSSNPLEEEEDVKPAAPGEQVIPKDQIPVKENEIEKILQDYETALMRRRRFYDRLDHINAIKEGWKLLEEFVARTRESLKVDPVNEMDSDTTDSTISAWPQKKETTTTEELGLVKKLADRILAFEAKLGEWKDLEQADMGVDQAEVKERRDEVVALIKAYEDALNCRKKHHERVKCLSEIDSQWTAYQKSVEDLSATLEPAPLEELGSDEIDDLVRKWPEKKMKYSMASAEMQKGLIEVLDFFENKQEDWSVLPALDREVVGKDEVSEKHSETREVVQTYEDALLKRMKHHERVKSLADIDEKWADYQKFVAGLADTFQTDPLEEMDAPTIEAKVAQWLEQKPKEQKTNDDKHQALDEAVETFNEKQEDWSVLPALERDVVQKDAVDEKHQEAKRILQEYERLLMKREKHHQRVKALATIDEQWAGYQEFVGEMTKSLDPVPLEEMEAEKIYSLVKKWDETKKSYQEKGNFLHKQLHKSVDHFESSQEEWSVLPALEREVIGKSDIDQKLAESEKVISEYEAALMKKKRRHDRAKCVAAIAEQWTDYLSYIGTIEEALQTEPLLEMEVAPIAELVTTWVSRKVKHQSKEASLRRVLLNLVEQYEAGLADWKDLDPLEEEVLSKDKIIGKQGEVAKMISEYEAVLMRRKRIHEREQCLSDIENSWDEYLNFVAKLGETLVVAEAEVLGKEDLQKKLSEWKSKEKNGLESEEARLYKAVVDFVVTYERKKNDFTKLDPLDKEVVDCEKAKGKHDEATQIIGDYEKALLLREKFHERAQCIEDISCRWLAHVAFVKELGENLKVEEVLVLEDEATEERLKSWLPEKVKSQAKDNTLQKFVVDKIEVYENKLPEWKELDPPVEEIIGRENVSGKKEESRKIIKDYEDALMKRKRYHERKRKHAHVMEETEKYTAWTDEILKTMEKFLEDHSKSILVTLMQEHKKLLKRLDELRSTSKEKHGGIGVKISNLEVSEEEAVIVEDGFISPDEQKRLQKEIDDQLERLNTNLDLKKQEFETLLREVQIQTSKEEFRDSLSQFQGWIEEKSGIVNGTKLQDITLETLPKTTKDIEKENLELGEQLEAKVGFLKKLWDVAEELKIQEHFDVNFEEAQKFEKVLVDAIATRDEALKQRALELHQENFEKLYVEYIDFVRNVNEKMTASVGEISKASELSELQVITKTADQEDPSHTKQNEMRFATLQKAAGVIERDDFKELKCKPGEIKVMEGLVLAEFVLKKDDPKRDAERVQNSAIVLHSSIIDRREKLNQKIREVKARDARIAWEKAMKEFSTWVPETCGGIMGRVNFGTTLEEGQEYKSKLDADDAGVRLESTKWMDNLKRLWKQVDYEIDPPSEKIEDAEKKLEDVENALKERNKMYQQKMCEFEREAIIEQFNEGLIDYHAWVDRIKTVWDMEDFMELASVKELKDRKEQILAENPGLGRRNNAEHDDLSALWEKIVIMEAQNAVNGNIDQVKSEKERFDSIADNRVARIDDAIEVMTRIEAYKKDLDEYILWVEDTIRIEGKFWNSKKAEPFRNSNAIKTYLNEVCGLAKTILKKNTALVNPLLVSLSEMEKYGLPNPVEFDERIRNFASTLEDGWRHFYEHTLAAEERERFRDGQEKRDAELGMERDLEMDDEEIRRNLLSRRQAEEDTKKAKGLASGSTTSKPKIDVFDVENYITVHLQEDGVDWESFGIEPPLCRFPYEKVENKMTFEIKAMIVDHLEARCHAHRIPALKKALPKFILVEKTKETADMIVLKRNDLLDRFQSLSEYENTLHFQEVYSSYHFEIRYSGTKFKPQEEVRVTVLMTDPLHGNAPVSAHTGNLTCEIKKTEDGSKEVLEGFNQTTPGTYELVKVFDTLGNYECMVQYNSFEIQSIPAKIYIVERKFLFW